MKKEKVVITKEETEKFTKYLYRIYDLGYTVEVHDNCYYFDGGASCYEFLEVPIEYDEPFPKTKHYWDILGKEEEIEFTEEERKLFHYIWEYVNKQHKYIMSRY